LLQLLSFKCFRHTSVTRHSELVQKVTSSTPIQLSSQHIIMQCTYLLCASSRQDKTKRDWFRLMDNTRTKI